MGVDIRFAIGLMFAIVGVVLAGFGLLGDESIYDKSLGININLIWGAVLVAFSLLLFWLSSRKGSQD